jgi:hypothetical protein
MIKRAVKDAMSGLARMQRVVPLHAHGLNPHGRTQASPRAMPMEYNLDMYRSPRKLLNQNVVASYADLAKVHCAIAMQSVSTERVYRACLQLKACPVASCQHAGQRTHNGDSGRRDAHKAIMDEHVRVYILPARCKMAQPAPSATFDIE